MIVKVRVRPDTGRLFFDFSMSGIRCREYTLLPDDAQNRKRMTKLAKRMSAEIELGQFDYLSYFPQGSKAEYFRVQHETRSLEVDRDASILFEDYVCLWWTRHSVTLRRSTQALYRGYLDKYLLPAFRGVFVSHLTKQQILGFRAEIAARSAAGAPPQAHDMPAASVAAAAQVGAKRLPRMGARVRRPPV